MNIPVQKRPRRAKQAWIAERVFALGVLVLVLVAIMTLCGCKSPGAVEVSLMEIDCRTAEQLRAAAYMETAVYGGPAQPAVPSDEKAMPISWWSALFKMLTDLECDIHLVKVRWKGGV